MKRILLVPTLPLERLAAMDKYAHRLHDWLESSEEDLDVRLAAHIGALTREPGWQSGRRRRSRGLVRWWTREFDPSRIILPPPLYGPHAFAARQVFYPLRLWDESRHADLVHILDHGYAHLLNRAHKRPVVVTVHDLMPVIVLRTADDGPFGRLRARMLRNTLKALRQATAFVVGTEWMKAELAAWLGDDRRIHVIPFGVDRSFFREAPAARERAREDWGIPDDAFVVLHVGSTVERKNVPLVIQTVARLRQDADAWLLQVGGRLTGAQEELVERHGLRGYVRSVPAADEATLRRAYRAADVLLFPSFYEGFGFPVLEAFASGLPVVTSGAGGLKEVAGDAGVVVEGRDVGGYVAAIEDLAADPARRDALAELGHRRAQAFGWQKTAERTAELYRRLG